VGGGGDGSVAEDRRSGSEGKDAELDELDTLPAAAMGRFKSNTELSAEQLVSLSPLRWLHQPALALRALSIALRMPPRQAAPQPRVGQRSASKPPDSTS
jgi:hypothetical protein